MLLLALLCAAEAEAQVVVVDRLSGHIELGVLARRQTTDLEGSSDRSFEELRLEERAGVKLGGYLVHRNLLRLSLGGTIGFRQGNRSSSFGSLGNDDSRLLEYDANVRLLPASRISLALFGNRFEDRLNQSFGTSTESSGDLAGATLHLGAPWFPSTLTWRNTSSQVESIGAAFPSQRSEERETFEFTGQRFTDRFRVSLRLREEEVDDGSFPPVPDYRTREAAATLATTFGDYLEKNLRTSLRYFEREGASTFESTSANTAFDWAITERFRSLLQHDFNRVDTDGFQTTENRGSLMLSHRLYDSLRSRLNLFGTASRRDEGSLDTYGARVAFDYRKRLPWQSRLRIDLTGGYRTRDTQLRGSVIPVRDERITVSQLTGLLLANARARPGSVEVFLGVGGPQLVEGIDYEIDPIGDQVAINVFPGGLVSQGDILSVSYDFLTDPSAEIATTSIRFGIAWSLPWLEIRYAHDEVEDRLRGGTAGFLQDSTRDELRAELIGEFDRLRATFAGRVAREQATTFEFDEWALDQTLRWPIATNLNLYLWARQSSRDFVRPVRETESLSAGGSLTWRLGGRSRLRLYANYRDLSDTISSDQTDIEAGLQGHVELAKIEVRPTLIWTQRERGNVSSEDIRFVFRIRRSF